MSHPKRYAVVGTGGRCAMFIEAAVKTHAEHARLVGLCDLSQVRMDYWNRRIVDDFDGEAVPTFHADVFDEMVMQTKPDVIIVTTVDATHHTYIIRALELGCDVVSEKPMTTDAVKAKAVLDAVEKTGRKVLVTFNCRYTPAATLLRQVIMEGKIGTPTLVDLMWTLNTSHGADYFRRWHREKDKSGGLLIHKSTHHFDLVNFWLGSRPKTVFAFGDLKFYGRNNAQQRGEMQAYDRYTDEPDAKGDPFALNLRDGGALEGLYLDAEKDDGYIRDRNVFGDNITAEDTMTVTAKYHSGALLSYSLVAYSPWEGLRACVTGTKGRVEMFESYGSHLIAGQGNDELADQQTISKIDTRTSGKFAYYYPMFGEPVELAIPEATGGHGGGDSRILDQIFLPDPPTDPFGRGATHIDGAASMLLGAAANQSIETGLPVEVNSLLELPVLSLVFGYLLNVDNDTARRARGLKRTRDATQCYGSHLFTIKQ